MPAILDGEVASWIEAVIACREHCRKMSRALLSMEDRLLGLQQQLNDAAAPTLLDSLPQPDEK